MPKFTPADWIAQHDRTLMAAGSLDPNDPAVPILEELATCYEILATVLAQMIAHEQGLRERLTSRSPPHTLWAYPAH